MYISYTKANKLRPPLHQQPCTRQEIASNFYDCTPAPSGTASTGVANGTVWPTSVDNDAGYATKADHVICNYQQGMCQQHIRKWGQQVTVHSSVHNLPISHLAYRAGPVSHSEHDVAYTHRMVHSQRVSSSVALKPTTCYAIITTRIATLSTFQRAHHKHSIPNSTRLVPTVVRRLSPPPLMGSTRMSSAPPPPTCAIQSVRRMTSTPPATSFRRPRHGRAGWPAACSTTACLGCVPVIKPRAPPCCPAAAAAAAPFPT
jgi:hypothetical protein